MNVKRRTGNMGPIQGSNHIVKNTVSKIGTVSSSNQASSIKNAVAMQPKPKGYGAIRNQVRPPIAGLS